MVRINTYYDTEIHREVFKVSGDVGYTKSTDCILKTCSVDTSRIEYAILTLSVDVVGEKGESNIIIYDNDTPVEVIVNDEVLPMLPWNPDLSEETVGVKLLYDVEHNLKARYLGNDKCLPSKSMTIPFVEAMPEAYSSQLERNTNTVRYDPNTDISVLLKFVSGKKLLEKQTRTVTVYVDNEVKGTVDIEVPANSTTGTGTYTINGGLSQGLHNIKAVFEGDSVNARAELSYDISVGYVVEIVSSPSSVVNNEYISYYINVKDYLGNTDGIRGYCYSIVDKDDFTYERTKDGITRFSNGNNVNPTIGHEFYEDMPNYSSTYPKILEYYARVTINGVKYYSDKIITNWYYNADVVLSSDTLLVSSGKTATLTAKVNNINEPISVTLTGGITGTTNTNSSNQVIKQYTGRGVGDVNITASINNSTSSVTIEDVMQYWTGGGNSLNKQYINGYGTLQELSNGFKMSALGNWFIIPLEQQDYNVSFNVVSASSKYKLNQLGATKEYSQSKAQLTYGWLVTTNNLIVNGIVVNGYTEELGVNNVSKTIQAPNMSLEGQTITVPLSNGATIEIDNAQLQFGFHLSNNTMSNNDGSKNYSSANLTFNNLKIKKV